MLFGQLYVSLYFSIALFYLYSSNMLWAPVMCSAYPLFISLVKGPFLWISGHLNMDNVIEFSSLAFAAMPYRFIYLEIDAYGVAFLIFTIKYIYKFIAYFIPLKFNIKKYLEKKC